MPFEKYITKVDARRDLDYVLDRILQLGPTNHAISKELSRQAGTVPPQVSGLTLTGRIGKIAVDWNAVQISDLKRYEIQVSTSPYFISPSTFYTRSTDFTYRTGVIGTTYYIRVRARNIAEATGEWSGGLNTTTRQVATEDVSLAAITTELITENACHVPSSEYIDDDLVINDGAEHDLVSVAHTSDGDKVFLWCNFQYGQHLLHSFIRVRVYMDEEVIYNYLFDVFNMPPVIWIYTRDVEPDAGEHEFKITWQKIVGVNPSTVSRRSLLVLETKR